MAMLRPLLSLALLTLMASLSACNGVSTPPPSQDLAQPDRPTQLDSQERTASRPSIASESQPRQPLSGKPPGSTTPPPLQSPTSSPDPDSDLAPPKSDDPEADRPSSSSEAEEWAIMAEEVFPELGQIKLEEVEYLTSNQNPDAALEKAILREMPDYAGELPPGFEIRYAYNRVDLNGDSTPEVLVYLSGYYTCGTGGCTMMVLQPNGDDYQLVSRIRLVNAPLLVSNQTNAGWHDLVLYVSGGGSAPHYVVLQHDGKGYPTNPSVAPEVPATATLKGTAILTDGVTFGEGVLLEPAQS